jgi:hypothetical protein
LTALREAESVIDQRLVHGPQQDRFFARRQPLDVPEIQLPGQHGRLVNHPDLLQVRANRVQRMRDEGGRMNRPFSSFILPPSSFLPFLVGERFVGQPHFEG